MRPILAGAFDLAPMDHSNVVPFPASANIRALALAAVAIQHRQRGLTIDRAVEIRAVDLARLGVSRSAALAELRAYEAALAEALELAPRRHGGGR